MFNTIKTAARVFASIAIVLLLASTIVGSLSIPYALDTIWDIDRK